MPKTSYIHPLIDVEAAVKSLLEVVDTPFVALSRNGDLLLLSWRMQALTGFSPGQSIGERFLETMFTEERRSEALAHLKAVMDGEPAASEPVQWTFTRRDGTERVLLLSGLPLKDSTGENIGVLYIGRGGGRQVAHAPSEPSTDPPVLRDEDENLTALVFRLDVAAGRIASMNLASRYLLGYQPEDFVTDPKLLSARVLPEYHEAFQAAVQDARRGVPRSIEVGFARRDNSTVILALMLYPGRNRQREVVAVEGVGRDITARKEAEAQLAESMEALQSAYDRLQAQHEELQSLDRLKSQVLANVSHELRTPLVTIRGYNELMLAEEMGSITERQRKGLEISAKSISRLLGLIENLIDFARLEKDRYHLHREAVDIGCLVADLAAEASDAMIAKELKLSLSLPREPALALGDGARLRQAFRNLLENAEKFCNPGGSVQIEVSRDASNVSVLVSDTGIGIPESEQGKIFDTFYQVDGSSTRHFPGLGIGLAIVKEIIELHGGRVEVKSEVGHGACFRVLLPAIGEGAPSSGSGPTGD
ncbi:MAG: PAS domain-containing sensor histidine kinase [Polyangia bacterium]|jgi:PAS domain S-box-containing protein|nr:PAS domain-containing sensor histidine kinase [Polyangia bacterium]